MPTNHSTHPILTVATFLTILNIPTPQLHPVQWNYRHNEARVYVQPPSVPFSSPTSSPVSRRKQSGRSVTANHWKLILSRCPPATYCVDQLAVATDLDRGQLHRLFRKHTHPQFSVTRPHRKRQLIITITIPPTPITTRRYPSPYPLPTPSHGRLIPDWSPPHAE